MRAADGDGALRIRETAAGGYKVYGNMTEQDSNGAVIGMSVGNAVWGATGGWAGELSIVSP